MAVTQYIPVGQVHRRDDARPRDEGAVRFLVESMKEVGQLTPILVRPNDGGFELIAGSHRLAAVEALGWQEVEARYAEHDDDLRAELAMIDENLCRSELSVAESAGQLARRKAIYEELHPETRNGSNQHTRVRQVGEGSISSENNGIERFTANAASATGRSERSVQRDTERGEKVLPEVLTLIRGTKLDTGTYLDKLKKLPANEQFTAAKRDLALSEKADAAEKTSGKGAPSRVPSRADAPAPECAGPTAHERLIAALDTLDGIIVADLISQCPPRQRASLCQRASSAIDLLSNVIEEASR